MDNLNLDTFIIGKSKPFEKKDPKIKTTINDLPKVIIQKIMFYLDITDLAKTALVCKKWDQSSVKWISKEKFSVVKNFIKILSDKLDKDIYSEKIEILANIEKDDKIAYSLNPKELKASTLEIRTKILNVMMKIRDLHDLEIKFEKKQIPLFFKKNIFFSQGLLRGRLFELFNRLPRKKCLPKENF